MRTYQEAYRWGVGQLESSAIMEAQIDARLLLEHICHTNRNDLLAHGERELTEEENNNYVNSINKRKKHIPLQHITGIQEFMGLEFFVNEHVLIPRQDTEILVEEAMLQLHDGMRLLDMCTGSGCILLSLLRYKNHCAGVGVDISKEALTVARKNAEKLCIDAAFLHSYLFDQVDGMFEVIVSNPPYIKSNVIPTLMPEVKEHEPMLALDGKADGLYFYREIIKRSKEHLCRGGKLFFEIGFDQGEEVSSLMKNAGFTDVSVKKDFAGLNRVVFGTFLEE